MLYNSIIFQSYVIFYKVVCFYSFYEFMILVASRFMANGNYGKLLGTFENDDEGMKMIDCTVLEIILFFMKICT